MMHAPRNFRQDDNGDWVHVGVEHVFPVAEPIFKTTIGVPLILESLNDDRNYFEIEGKRFFLSREMVRDLLQFAGARQLTEINYPLTWNVLVAGASDLSLHQNTKSEHSSAKIIRQLPTLFVISLVLLNRKDRDEVLADIQEWYQEIADARGAGWAKLFVCGKLFSVYSGQVLSVLERLAGIIGKVRPQK